LNNPLQVNQHISRRNAQSTKALIGKPFIARVVMKSDFGRTMRLAVNFDCQPRLHTREVENIWSGRMLASEFEAGRRFRSSRHSKTSGKDISRRSFRARPTASGVPLSIHPS